MCILGIVFYVYIYMFLMFVKFIFDKVDLRGRRYGFSIEGIRF